MPTYTFKNKKTEEIFDKFMSWNDRQKYLEENTDIEPVVTAPGISYNDAKKPDDGFRDVLRNVKKHHPLGDINTF